MKRKALLIGARSSFEGPAVALEEGRWLVQPDGVKGLVVLMVERDGELSELPLDSSLTIMGPCSVRARVRAECDKDIYLSAEATF